MHLNNIINKTMENKKETVVDWLKENLPSLFQDDSGHYQKLFEQAKEMEKKQITKAFDKGETNFAYNGKYLNGTDYYKENYGK